MSAMLLLLDVVPPFEFDMLFYVLTTFLYSPLF